MIIKIQILDKNLFLFKNFRNCVNSFYSYIFTTGYWFCYFYFIIYFCMMFISGIRIRWFFIAGGVLIFFLGIYFWYFLFTTRFIINLLGTDLFYRFERIFSWQSGTGLQLENALAALDQQGSLDMDLIRLQFIFQSLLPILSLLFLLLILDFLVLLFF